MANGHGRIVRVEPAVPPAAQGVLTCVDAHVSYGTQHLSTGKGCCATMVPTPQAGSCCRIHVPWRHRARADHLAGKRTDVARVVIGHIVEQPVHDAELTLTVHTAHVGA